MQVRYLGGRLVLCRSFARIHETNLKKQGVLPLTFADPADYDRVHQGTLVETLNLRDLAPGAPVVLRFKQLDGTSTTVSCSHTLNAEQVEFFKAGSALNLVRSQANQS
jgi:aconitase A